MKDNRDIKRHSDTLLAQAGRRSEWTHGIVNPPVYRASTCLFDTLADLDTAIKNPDGGLYYGRRGVPTIWALEEALTQLEPGAAGTKLYPSGVAALATALMALCQAGDHILVADNVYDPTRNFCTRTLARYGVEISYYDPLIGADIEKHIQPNTRVIFLESPGSLTMEVQDVPAIVAVARAHGIATIMDNTWATPLYFNAIAKGVDVVMQSLTKYVVGHSDAMGGALTVAPSVWDKIKLQHAQLGQCMGPDEVALALRGLRTLALRLARHDQNARTVAQWLAEHPKVDRVLHPALPSCPGHDFWRRDFTGASGLFSITLKKGARADVAPLVDHLRHFGMGFSWGGYESLILPMEPQKFRTVTAWDVPGQLLRLHIGLEDPQDLIADLAQGLERLS